MLLRSVCERLGIAPCAKNQCLVRYVGRLAVLARGLRVCVVEACGRVGAGCEACRRAFFWVRFPGPKKGTGPMSSDCRWTWFAALFSGRFPAPLLGPPRRQGRTARRRRCGDVFLAACSPMRGRSRPLAVSVRCGNQGPGFVLGPWPRLFAGGRPCSGTGVPAALAASAQACLSGKRLGAWRSA